MVDKDLPRPSVGIAVIVLNSEGSVLVGERKGAPGAGTWALPGGHLEHGESWAECSVREVKEETDLAVEFIGHVAVTNNIFESEQKHYITIFVVCRMKNPEAKPMNLEPHKCSWWAWKSWDDITECSTKFIPLENLLTQHPDISSRVQTLVDSE